MLGRYGHSIIEPTKPFNPINTKLAKKNKITFSKSKKLEYKKIPFFIDSENEKDAEILKNLALKISENVMFAND